MSYKKFIKRGDKTYGPYSYKSVKVNGKVTTEYLGKFKVPREKGFLKFLIPIVALLFLGLFLLLNNFNLTGNVSMDLQSNYYSGEQINGNLKLNLEQGELLPASTKIVINNAGEIQEYFLNDLIGSGNLVNGTFYLANKNVSGFGEGFGVAGEKISYPNVNFVLKVLDSETNNSLDNENFSEENKNNITSESSENNFSSSGSSSGGSEIIEEVPTSGTETTSTSEIDLETTIPETSVETSSTSEVVVPSETSIEPATSTEIIPTTSTTQTSNENIDSEIVQEVSQENSATEEISSSESSTESASESSFTSSSESSETSSPESSQSSTESSSSDSSSESSSSPITGGVISEESSNLIEGNVSKNFPFHYQIEEGKNVEIVSSENEINLNVKNDWVDVETDYEKIETGFGAEYSGKENLQLNIDLSQLNLNAKEGELSIKLVYDNSEIVSLSKKINVYENETLLNETVINETIVENNSSINTTQYGAVINKPVRWKKIVTFNETNEIINVELPKEAENISVFKIFEGENEISEDTNLENNSDSEELINKNNFVENQDNFSEEVEENFSQEIVDTNNSEEKIIEELPSENFNILTGQVSAELNLQNKNNFKNFFKKVFSSITGKSVDVQETEEVTQVVIENENSTQIEIVYETPGPTSNETNTSYGKEIIISSEVHYQNILAYTELEKPTEFSWIKLYQIDENGNRILTQFNAYDFEGNEIKTNVESVNETYNFSITEIINETDSMVFTNKKLVSYIEWVVPHLSEQKYELVIAITGAEHFDQNRTFISDIYNETKNLDGNWSEEIKPNEFVRVTFEKPLTNKNDITIYAKTLNETASVEIYSADDNSYLISTIDNISSEKLIKTYLISLGENESYITFDLKVLNSSVWFDYIVDPVLLNSSVGIGTNTTTEVNFTHLTINDGSLLLYMPFDVNTSGKTYDYSRYNNDGTLNGNVTWNETDGKYGGDYHLDGYNDYISIADSTSLDIGTNNFTFTAWVKLDNRTGQQIIGRHGGGYNTANPGWSITTSNGVPFIQFSSSSQVYNNEGLTGASTLSMNQWYFVSGTFDRQGNFTWYLNGVQNGNQINISNSSGVNINPSGNLYLGLTTVFTINGSLDDVMVFNRSLSSIEVAQIYNSTFQRFYPYGEQTFNNVDFQSNNTIANLTLQDCQQLNGSYLQGKINNDAYQNFSGCNLNNLNITQQFSNLTIKYFSTPYQFYSPILFGNITLDYTFNLTSCGNLTNSGYYTLNNNITSTETCFNIQAQNVTLDCQGNWINYSTSGSALDFGVYSNQFNSTVKNCNIVDGNWSSTTNNRYGVLYDTNDNSTISNTLVNTSNSVGVYLFTNADFNNVTNNNISSNLTYALYVNDASNGVIDSNILYSKLGTTLFLASNSNNNILTNNNVTSTSSVGILLQTSQFNNLTNNFAITSSPTTFHAGIRIDSGNNTLINNTGVSVSTPTGGIVMYSISASNNTLINNTGISLNGRGIYLYTNGNNLLTSNTGISNALYGIDISNSNEIIIINNTGISNSGHGIYLINSSNNTLVSNIGMSNFSNGIYVYSNSSNNTLQNNLGISNGTSSYAGIFVQLTFNNILINNTGRGNVSVGIEMISSNENILIGNTGISNTSHGIFISANLCNLTNNTGTSNALRGIMLYQASNNLLINNTGKSNTEMAILLSTSSNNNILINTNASGGYGYYVDLSSNNLIKDCVYTFGTVFDVSITSGSSSMNNTFLNCSYRLNKERVLGTNELIRKWYYQTYVNYSNGTTVSNAQVTAYNSTNNLEFNSTTNSSGYIQKTPITEYINYGGTRTYSSNYTVNATDGTYNSLAYSRNITTNKLDDALTLNLVTNIEVPTNISWMTTGGFSDSSLSFLQTIDYINATCNGTITGCNLTIARPDGSLLVNNSAMNNYSNNIWNYTTDFVLDSAGTWIVNVTAYLDSAANTTSANFSVATANLTTTDGWYGCSNGNIPSSTEIGDFLGYECNLAEFNSSITNISNSWGNILTSINNSKSANIKVGLNFVLDFNYTNSAELNSVKENITNKFVNLTLSNYQIAIEYISLELTNSDSYNSTQKDSVINDIAHNITSVTDNNYVIYSKNYNSSGLDGAYIQSTKIIYLDNSTLSSWIGQENYLMRNYDSLNRIYVSMNSTLMSSVKNFQRDIIARLRAKPDSTNLVETKSAKINNGDVVVFNEQATSQNFIINVSEDSAVLGKDIWDDTHKLLVEKNTDLNFSVNVSAHSATMLIFEDLDHIQMSSDNSGSLYKNSASVSKNFSYTDDVNDGNWMIDNFADEIRWEGFDPFYKTNNFLVYYGWIDYSYVTNWSAYEVVILDHENSTLVSSVLANTTNTELYFYVSVADYENNDAWVNTKKAEVDAIIALNESSRINVFVDGLDAGIGGTNFSTRFKQVVDYVKVDKGRKVGLNTYTAYEDFCTWSQPDGFCLKESCARRWNGANAGAPDSYTWENWTLETEKSVWYNSHNINVLCQAFDNRTTDTYEPTNWTTIQDTHFASLVLGYNDFYISQPDFNYAHTIYNYDAGTKMAQRFSTDDNQTYYRRYANGIVYFNTSSGDGWIDDGREVQAQVCFKLYDNSDGPGDDEMNWQFRVNNVSTNNIYQYTIPGNSITAGVWNWYCTTLNQSQVSLDGAYKIEGTTSDTGTAADGIFIGWANTANSGIHSWYSTTAGDPTWNYYPQNQNWEIKLVVNETKKASVDTLSNKITQTNSTYDGYTNLTISSSTAYDLEVWSNPITVQSYSGLNYNNGTSSVVMNPLSTSTCNSNNPSWGTDSIDGETYKSCYFTSGTSTIVRVSVPHMSNHEFNITVNDTAFPRMQFENSTTENGTYSQSYISVNVSAQDNFLNSIYVHLYNSSMELVNSTSNSVSPFAFNFTNLSDGTYYLNSTANDTNGNSNFTGTRIIILDTTLPSMNITYPINKSYAINVSELNYTLTETNSDKCWYSTNNGMTNSSLVTAGENFTGITSTEGSNDWRVYCNDTAGNENSTNVSFVVDTTAPIVTIVSPTATTYADTFISFSVNTNENSTCNYSLNSGTDNYSLTANVVGTSHTASRTLPYATYSANIYCSDLLGNSDNSKNVLFTITAPETPTTVSSGGGGGGAPVYQPAVGFSTNIDSYETSISLNRIEFGKITITNDGDLTEEYSINVQTIGDIISFEENKVTIESKGSRTIEFKVLSPKESGIYTGKIIISVGSKKKEILASVNVKTEKNLFDITLLIPKSSKTISPGSNLQSQINLLEMGLKENIDVTLRYTIKDFEGNVYLTESETIAVYDQKTIEKEFHTEELQSGNYVLGVELIYPDGVAVASSHFQVKEKTLSNNRLLIYFIFGIVVIIFSALILGIRKYKSMSKKLKRFSK